MTHVLCLFPVKIDKEKQKLRVDRQVEVNNYLNNLSINHQFIFNISHYHTTENNRKKIPSTFSSYFWSEI